VLSQAEAKLHAASIMRFGSDVEQAVRRLTTIGGCDIEEVSFEAAPFDGSDTDYVNPNSPTDKSCHVFHGNGGQVERVAVAEKWLDGVSTSRVGYGEFFFLVVCVNGAGQYFSGSPCSGNNDAIAEHGDLIIFLPYIHEAICRDIVKRAFGTDTIPTDTGISLFEEYKGTYSIGTTSHISYDSVGGENKFNSSGILYGCYTPGNSGASYMEVGDYAFYSTLYIK
jgi:hypothetical protein